MLAYWGDQMDEYNGILRVLISRRPCSSRTSIEYRARLELTICLPESSPKSGDINYAPHFAFVLNYVSTINKAGCLLLQHPHGCTKLGLQTH